MRHHLLGLLLPVALIGCAAQAPGPTPPPSPAVSATVSAPPAPTASPTPTAAATAVASVAPSPTVAPTPAPAALCLATQLAATVTGWEGAAGHQIASVRLVNESPIACVVQGTPGVQLVDARGVILIDSAAVGEGGLPHVDPGAEPFLLDPGAVIGTEVSAADYCGAAEAALPTTIAFVLPADAGRVVAAPGPGGDVPGCLSSPGAPGSIAMNGWTR